MKYFHVFLALLMSLSCDVSQGKKQGSKILIFSKTTGYRHDCIEHASAKIARSLKINGFESEHTEDSELFRLDYLRQFDAVIFLCTTGDVFSDTEQEAFKKYIQSGGGFAGIHSATDTEYDWPWYNGLVGAYFADHPPGLHEASLDQIDPDHVSTAHLSDPWVRTDEWYNFRSFAPELNVLINLDESTYQGGTMGINHPIAWYKEYDGGKSWYTGMGHTRESYDDEDFMRHIIGGVKYVTQ